MIWFLLSVLLALWLWLAPQSLPDLFILGGLDFHLRYFAVALLGFLFALFAFIGFGPRFFRLASLAMAGAFIWLSVQSGSLAYMNELLTTLQAHTHRAATTNQT